MHSKYTKYLFFFQAEDGIRDATVTGVQTCALPISSGTDSVEQVNPEIPGHGCEPVSRTVAEPVPGAAWVFGVPCRRDPPPPQAASAPTRTTASSHCHRTRMPVPTPAAARQY